MRIGRNTAAVIADKYGIVRFQFQFDPVRVASDRFVHGVIQDLCDQMVQGRIIGAADIHTGAATHRLQAFENLDVLGGIGFVCGLV